MHVFTCGVEKMEPTIYKFKALVKEYRKGRLYDAVESRACFTSIFDVHETLTNTHDFLRSKRATEITKLKNGKFAHVPVRKAPSMDFICNLPVDVVLDVKELSYFEKDGTEMVIAYTVRRIPAPATPLKRDILGFKPTTQLKSR